ARSCYPGIIAGWRERGGRPRRESGRPGRDDRNEEIGRRL
ncbi:MAG: hypothetical protein AVDCRST_MAG64-3960, partial [uncultured Phycisphaerae bacterium]